MIIRRDFERYDTTKIGQQRKSRPLAGGAGTIARNPAQPIKKQNIAAISVGRNQLLKTIDHLQSQYSTFGQTIEMEGDELCIKLSFVIGGLNFDQWRQFIPERLLISRGGAAGS